MVLPFESSAKTASAAVWPAVVSTGTDRLTSSATVLGIGAGVSLSVARAWVPLAVSVK